MSFSQSRKLPVQHQMADTAIKRAGEVLDTKGLSLPCKITAIVGRLVTVEFTVSGISLPARTIPIAESLYSQAPYQIGDRGVARPADASVAEACGQITTQPPIGGTGNLGALVFYPISSKSWSATPSDLYLLQGPKGFQIQSLDGTVSIVGSKSAGSLIAAYGSTKWTMNSDGHTFDGNITVNGTVAATGDVKAGSISLQEHDHEVTAAPGTTGPAQG